MRRDGEHREFIAVEVAEVGEIVAELRVAAETWISFNDFKLYRKAPIALLVKNVDVYSTVKVDYHGGLKYPHLVRAEGKDLLTAITAPRK